MSRYRCSGVVRDRKQSKIITAVSEKQAEFFFKREYGYAMRNFQIQFISSPFREPYHVAEQGTQLRFI